MIVAGVRDIRAENSVNFGWNHATHRYITAKLLAKYNSALPKKIRFNEEILRYSCVEPDFSRRNITKYIHGHFADIDNPSTEPADAFCLAVRYTNKALEAHSNGLYSKRDDYLGYALHFVEDMLNPMHVVFVPVPKGHPERVLHKKFEGIAEGVMYKEIEKIEPIAKDSDLPFFEKILPDAMRRTKNLMIRIKGDENADLSQISAEAIKNTYETTSQYFVKFISQIKCNDIASTNAKKLRKLTILEEIGAQSA